MGPPRVPPDHDHHTSRRVRELYRYFQPQREPQPLVTSYFDSWVSNVPWPSDDPPAPAVATPNPATLSTPASDKGLVLGNPNRTLTSFAQLAALHLNVERVLISVSDRDSQFVLAESTPSATLDATVEQGPLKNDKLWTGCSTVSDAWSMCTVSSDLACAHQPVSCAQPNGLAKGTIALPPSTQEPPQYHFLIVNDLSRDDRYKSLPFVQGDPNFRFYAGTPLTTESNINIGCLFALDIQPRDGLNSAQKEVMGSLGMLIMDHLKISRQAHEGRRATRLSRGLSCFVEGGSSFADSTDPSYASSPYLVSSHPPSNVHTNTLSVDSLDCHDPPSRRSQSCDTRSTGSYTGSKADQSDSMSGTLPPDFLSTIGRKGPPADETHDTSWPFKRAANLLRESLELGDEGGVMFLEAGNNPGLDPESGSDSAGETGNPASVLAISTQDEPFAGPGSKVIYPATNLDRGFLLRLFRRYGKGRLWGFHRDGMLSSSEDDDSEESRESRPGPRKPADLPKGKVKRKGMENKLLNEYFPSASQVLFVPLWNAANSQWFAGCFCWNSVETRVFSPSVELSSVLGFSSSIMAEYSRIQSLISDRQKGDFIGSISHELRSPLHGILAAAEFLQGTPLDEFQGSLLETIDSCGRTLLDTMNQVLDFSKIVSLERTWRNIKRQKASISNAQGMEKVHLDSYMATDLGVLAEEVVEGVCLGHAYGQRATASSDRPVFLPHTTARDQQTADPNKQTEVEVMMDIAQNDWIYRTQPGALRRILMNILGNAMKYTDYGHVSVHLEVTESSESRSRQGNTEDLVTLTVSDTGKGISDEFLRARLYTPFSQEDALAVGTGLGMSIVRSLVKALDGSVNTYSRPGHGTMVRVTLPLERPQQEEHENVSPRPDLIEKDTLSQARLLRENFAGRRVAILGVDPVSAVQHPLWSIVARYVTEWYGLELASWPPATAPVDIVLADEQMLAIECENEISPRVPALLVLCNKSVDYATARSRWSDLAHSVEMIRQPSGPHKLARSIRKSLETARDAPTTIPPASIQLPERPNSQADFFTRGEPSLSIKQIDLPGVPPQLTTPELTTSSEASTSTKSPDSESEPQTFTTAPGTLPLSVGPASPLQKLNQPPPDIVEPPRVLVVDDNSINLSLMLTFMKKRNLTALDAAENGKVAVEAAERMGGYDLIFLGTSLRYSPCLEHQVLTKSADMSMPIMDGFEAARTIRALEKEYHDTYRRATIIALTGLSSTRDEDDALASGVDLFLTKPVSFKEVSRLLGEWEERRLGPSPSVVD